MSWNWAGLFGGIFWLGYRKMYLNATIITGLFTVLNIALIFYGEDLSKNLGIAVSGVFSILGNALYFKHMKQKITKLKKNITDPEALKAEIVRAGGVSWMGVGLVGLLTVLQLIIIQISYSLWG